MNHRLDSDHLAIADQITYRHQDQVPRSTSGGLDTFLQPLIPQLQPIEIKVPNSVLLAPIDTAPAAHDLLLNTIDDVFFSAGESTITYAIGISHSHRLRPLDRCSFFSTLPLMTFSFLGVGDPAAAFLPPRGFFGVVSLLLVVAEEVVLVDWPRGGAAGRAPVSISSLSFLASRLMMRKRPSMES